ncbi:MAG: hypothetical protein HYY62_07045 [Deltaproteobacteria bacterium]|nr:hypothetical protein [Deltaproteobacteria bacterium]
MSYIWLSEHHKDPQVRKEALILTLRDEDMVTKKLSGFSLEQHLSQEQNPEVRAAIIAQLPRSVKYQNKVLEHLKAHSQEAPVIIASLYFLSGAQETQDFISLAESYLDHENPEVARAALHGIMRHDGPAGLGDERAIHLVRHNPHPYVRQVAAGLVPNTPEGNAILREVFTAAQDVEVKAEMASELLGRGAGDEALVSFLFREFEHHGELGRNIKLGLTPQTLPMYQKVFSELDLFPLTQGLIRQEIRAFELKHRSD